MAELEGELNFCQWGKSDKWWMQTISEWLEENYYHECVAPSSSSVDSAVTANMAKHRRACNYYNPLNKYR